MGMGAPKPGSTLPPQGGKGGVQPPVQPTIPPQGTYPGMPLTPHPSSPYYFPNGPEPSAQALNQGKGQGVPMGGLLGGGGNPIQPQVPPQQPTIPSAGGKGQPSFPFQGQTPDQPIPPQGGKGEVQPPVQPTLPPQGGKGGIINNPQLQQTVQLAQSLQQLQQPPMQIQGVSRGQPSYGPTSQEAYNRFLATAMPVQGGSLPSYEQFVQNRSAPRPFLGPQRPRPNVFPQPQQPGLGGLQVNKFRNRLG